ncbi:hypothetical protein F7731_08490 [Cytobacillus depressus]|uniref:Uncharacterized protein n=1 Tax=Cytobacillus depressus TaxID=1602942 RepID=A0A6L3V877_9BACI|nr:hypothetical protein [Cytobacillus depressus]KAB2337624.1 hypothetical protein F7731_08490 [Cytobacillus depressus]
MELKSNIQSLIFSYIRHCFDEYGILPNEDDVYLRFQIHFDNGVPFEIAEEEMRKFARFHDLTDIDIRWEGELDGNNSRRIEAHPEIP